MPWVLAALLAATGAIYYESNKKPSSYKVQLKFPPASNMLPALMNAVTFVGGTVETTGDADTFLITLPAAADLSRVFQALPTAPILTTFQDPNVKVSGVHEFADNVMPVYERTNKPLTGVMVGGVHWDGRAVR